MLWLQSSCMDFQSTLVLNHWIGFFSAEPTNTLRTSFKSYSNLIYRHMVRHFLSLTGILRKLGNLLWQALWGGIAFDLALQEPQVSLFLPFVLVSNEFQKKKHTSFNLLHSFPRWRRYKRNCDSCAAALHLWPSSSLWFDMREIKNQTFFALPLSIIRFSCLRLWKTSWLEVLYLSFSN